VDDRSEGAVSTSHGPYEPIETGLGPQSPVDHLGPRSVADRGKPVADGGLIRLKARVSRRHPVQPKIIPQVTPADSLSFRHLPAAKVA